MHFDLSHSLLVLLTSLHVSLAFLDQGLYLVRLLDIRDCCSLLDQIIKLLLEVWIIFVRCLFKRHQLIMHSSLLLVVRFDINRGQTSSAH